MSEKNLHLLVNMSHICSRTKKLWISTSWINRRACLSWDPSIHSFLLGVAIMGVGPPGVTGAVRSPCSPLAAACVLSLPPPSPNPCPPARLLAPREEFHSLSELGRWTGVEKGALGQDCQGRPHSGSFSWATGQRLHFPQIFLRAPPLLLIIRAPAKASPNKSFRGGLRGVLQLLIQLKFSLLGSWAPQLGGCFHVPGHSVRPGGPVCLGCTGALSTVGPLSHSSLMNPFSKQVLTPST